MAFDLAAQPPRVAEWDHERAAAEVFTGSFADWLDAQLDLEGDLELEEKRATDDQRRWASLHTPFCESPFGKQVLLRLQTKSGDILRDVLLDLHLQYTFQPRVVTNGGISYIGLLHFRKDALGCWKCGKFNTDTTEQCAHCGEGLLRGTYLESRNLSHHTTAWDEPFGIWASRNLSLDAPKPVLVATPSQPRGIPSWARLKRFGGTRDPRIPADALTDGWDPPAGDTI
jgi:hypothetical protein